MRKKKEIVAAGAPIKKFYLCDGNLPCANHWNCKLHHENGQCQYTTDKNHAKDGGHIYVDSKGGIPMANTPALILNQSEIVYEKVFSFWNWNVRTFDSRDRMLLVSLEVPKDNT